MSDFIPLTKTYPAKHMVYVDAEDIVAFGPNMQEAGVTKGSVVYLSSGEKLFVAEDSEKISSLISGC